MPIKFSALTEKTLDNSSYIVGLYNDSTVTSTGKNNCVINASQFAKSSDITTLNNTITEKDGNVVHKTGEETISGKKTFTGSIVSSGLNTFSGNNTFSSTNTFSGTNTFTNTNTFSGTISSSGNNTFSGSNIFASTSTFNGNITSNGTNTFNGFNTFNKSITIAKDVHINCYVSGVSGAARLRLGQYSTGQLYSGIQVTGTDGTDNYFQITGLGSCDASTNIKQSIDNWGMPNYSSVISISTGYVAEKNGYIRVRWISEGGTSNVSINGVRVVGNDRTWAGDWEGSYCWSITPIAKGQTVTASGSYDNLTFIPCLGG